MRTIVILAAAGFICGMGIGVWLGLVLVGTVRGVDAAIWESTRRCAW